MGKDSNEAQKRTVKVSAKVASKVATKQPAKTQAEEGGFRFCGRRIGFNDADVAKAFAKVKADDLDKPRSYYVKVKGVEQPLSIPQVIQKMTGIALEWKQNPKSGSVNGTYSTGNAAKLLARMGVSVFGKDGTRVVYVAPEKKAEKEAPAKGATKAAAKKVATKGASRNTPATPLRKAEKDAKAAAKKAAAKGKGR